jgi:integrase
VRGEFDIEKPSSITLDEVFEKFLSWAKKNKASWLDDKQNYHRNIKPVFANKQLGGITQFDVEKFIIKLKKGKNKRGKHFAPATIKHQVQLLSRLFTLAWQWGLYKGDNPCKRVKKPKLNNKITEFFSEEELIRLHQTLEIWPNRMTVSIILFTMYTGIRRGEVFKLTWDDVDLNRRIFTLRDPKGILDQILPLSSEATEVLRKVPREYNTKWVFYGKNGQQRTDFKGPWARIRKAANLPKTYRFHGLRHNFASYLASSGESIYMVQKLMCHKDVKTTMRYAHLTDQAKRQAAIRSGALLKPKKIINTEIIANPLIVL